MNWTRDAIWKLDKLISIIEGDWNIWIIISNINNYRCKEQLKVENGAYREDITAIWLDKTVILYEM